MSLIKLLLLAIFAAALSPVADELSLTVPPLIKEQPLIDSIYKIGPHIVVSVEEQTAKSGDLHHSFWEVDEQKDRLIPFAVKNGERVIAVTGNSRSTLIAASAGKNKIHLVYPDQPTRTTYIKTPDDGPFHLAENNRFIYLVFTDMVVEVPRRGVERTIKLDVILTERWKSIARAIVATDDELILGYDEGEWGGGAYAIKVSEKGLTTEYRKLTSENVCAINLDSKDGIWIAGGLSHMVGRQASLHYYNGKTVRPIIFANDFHEKNGKQAIRSEVVLPKPTAINGMTINAEDDVLLVASEAGLFSYAADKPLSILWSGNLYITYERPGVIVGGFPQGVVEKDRHLYVASRSLGVFRFDAIGSTAYIPVKQIIFER
ncbi:MAG: hypothetical protein JXA73_19900 [Acidobacteria bacterium]|nr:hypothetical protein [Acidobacteriota bacterium]